jgi:hypothetical protein
MVGKANDEKSQTHDRKRMTWRKLGLISINTFLRPTHDHRTEAALANLNLELVLRSKQVL